MSQTEWPAPGWYPDGLDDRFWDGSSWTAQRRPASSGPLVPYPTSPASPEGAPGPRPSAVTVNRRWSAEAEIREDPLTGGPVVAPKNPALSLIVSFLAPGAGTIINGEVGKGVAILAAWSFCFFFMWFFLIPALGVIGLWIYGMVDGYQGAQRWNLHHGIIS